LFIFIIFIIFYYLFVFCFIFGGLVLVCIVVFGLAYPLERTAVRLGYQIGLDLYIV